MEETIAMPQTKVTHTPLDIHTFDTGTPCEHCGASQAPFEIHPIDDEHGVVVVADVFDAKAANLFASAPELLEALDYMAEASDKLLAALGPNTAGAVNGGYIHLNNALEAAQAALAAARGGE